MYCVQRLPILIDFRCLFRIKFAFKVRAKMPVPKPRQRAGAINQAKRGQKRPRYDENDEIIQLVDPIEEPEDVLNTSIGNLHIENTHNQSTQTNLKTFCDQSTQTFDIGSSPFLSSFHRYFNFAHVSNLISILADTIPNFNNVQRRILSYSQSI